ncbi:hypothetical protein TrRE_jg162 [Triparma retinervis]|uniref:Coiled-coil domain-containing protein n=1 Tax=Triparma retinervis TaxID=2557542 RepID=A0A9W6ZQK0_9STRA|nr:hypothetical protein TrRE_jg162 [Triparma retinervis]
MGGIKKVKSGSGGPKKKGGGKKKKGGDLSFLEDSLVSGAEKKAKDKKKKEKEKKEREAREAQERSLALEQSRLAGSLTGNGIVDVNEVIGTVDGDVVRPVNQLDDPDGVTGIEAGINIFKFGEGRDPSLPKPNMKALHKAFEEKMMAEVKEGHPGLKLRQYQQKIFDMWQKSPENPNNNANWGKR